MRYKELMKDYHSKGMVSEKKMWEAIGELDEAMECLKEKDPEKYDEAIRDIHEVFAVLIIMSISLRWTWRQCVIKARRESIKASTGIWSRWLPL